MSNIARIVLGLPAGKIAKAIMPGGEPAGVVVTTLFGSSSRLA